VPLRLWFCKQRMVIRTALTTLMALSGCTVDNPAYRFESNVDQPDGQRGVGGQGGDDSSDAAPFSRDAVPLVLDTSRPTPDASPRAGSFFDDFEADAISPSWQVNVSGAGCTVSQSTGSLRFRMVGPTGLCTVRSVKTYDIGMDAVFFRIDPITTFHAPVRCFMFIEADGRRFEYGFVNDMMEAQLLALPSRISSWRMTGTYRPRPYEWRIRADANTVFFEHSVDGDAWTATATHAAVFPSADVHVGVGVEVQSTIPGIIGIGVAGYNR
jgi:hypothetical protein